MFPSDSAAGLAVITFAGIVVTEPQLHSTTDDVIARFAVAATERQCDQVAGQRMDAGPPLLPCSIGHQAARNVAASLTIGTRVLITGVLRQREWEDTTGEKRYAYEVLATEVAVSLNYAMVWVIQAEHGPQ
jgi:single-strand DNA-binding protein